MVKPTMSANRTVTGSIRSAMVRSPRPSRAMTAARQDIVEQRLGPALLGVEPVEVMALAVAQALALEGGGDPGAQDRGSNGLRMKSWAPAARHWPVMSEWSMPERTRTGSSASAGRARMASSTSRPFMPGISRSSRTRSTGASRRAALRPRRRRRPAPPGGRPGSGCPRAAAGCSRGRRSRGCGRDWRPAGGCSPSAVAHRAAASSRRPVVGPAARASRSTRSRNSRDPLDQSLQVRRAAGSAVLEPAARRSR